MKLAKLVKSNLDDTILELVCVSDHKTLMTWACDCAERSLPYFEKNYPNDPRPRIAVEAGRTWARTGIFKMADVRKASLDAHAAARAVTDDDPARSAARAAGQAMATAHVPTHSYAASVYAATAVRDSTIDGDKAAAVAKERQWQYKHLLELQNPSSTTT